jgi:vacuolar-type H+-ATPase subunit I/STV1
VGLREKLRQVSAAVRKLRLSRGPDSYFRYKRKREYERKRDDRQREHTAGEAEREREQAERERNYEERYTGERQRHTARERTEHPDETEPDT